MMAGRKEPYTELGIKRVPCARCSKPSHAQWQICADGNTYRGLCKTCDVALNAMVLKWARDPLWKDKMTAYRLC